MTRSLSVVLVTSDDAERLPRLLESLQGSAVAPTELVVHDDHSGDGTVDLLRGFAGRARFPVDIHVNDRKRGPIDTYGAALAACRGELIAIADAGDRWLPSKIPTTLEAFAAGGQIGLFFTDGVLSDRAETLFGSVGLTPSRLAAAQGGGLLPLLVPYPLVGASTCTFLADLREVLLPLPHITTVDHWIPLVATLTRPYAMSDEALIERSSTPDAAPAAVLPDESGLKRWRTRLRSASTKGNPKLADAHRFVRQTQAMLYEEILRRHETAIVGYQARHQVTPPAQTEETLRDITERAEHLRTRGSMPDSRVKRVGPILREVRRGRYTRYSAGPLSALQDFIG